MMTVATASALYSINIVSGNLAAAREALWAAESAGEGPEVSAARARVQALEAEYRQALYDLPI